MEPHRVRQETAYLSLAYGLFGLGRFLPQIPDSYKRVIFMSICGSIQLSLDKHVPETPRMIGKKRMRKDTPAASQMRRANAEMTKPPKERLQRGFALMI